MKEFVSLFALTTLAEHIKISSRLPWTLIARDPDGPTKFVGLGVEALVEKVAEIGRESIDRIYIHGDNNGA